MKTKYLIFGSGFIASHLSEALLAQNSEVRVVYRKAPNKNIPKNIQINIKNHIDDIKKLLLTYKPDYLILTQGVSFIPNTEKDIDRSIDSNLISPLKTLEAVYLLTISKKIKLKKILTFGSAAEYGDGSKKPFTEKSKEHPSSLYGLSKFWLYQVSRYYSDLGLPCVHLRQFNAIGAYQDAHFVVSSFCKQVALIEKNKQKPILWVGDLKQKRDFIDIRDAVNGYLLVTKKASPGSIINVCTGKSYFINDIVNCLHRLSAVSFKTKTNPKLIVHKRTRNNVLAGKPLGLKKLGWKKKYSLEESVSWTLEYWRKKV